MSGIQTTENAACQQGDLEEKREGRWEWKYPWETERESKKELEPAERERWSEGALLSSPALLPTLSLFAKVQSSGTDRKVKINRRRSEFFTTFSSSSSSTAAVPETLRVSFRRRRRRRRRRGRGQGGGRGQVLRGAVGRGPRPRAQRFYGSVA